MLILSWRIQVQNFQFILSDPWILSSEKIWIPKSKFKIQLQKPQTLVIVTCPWQTHSWQTHSQRRLWRLQDLSQSNVIQGIIFILKQASKQTSKSPQSYQSTVEHWGSQSSRLCPQRQVAGRKKRCLQSIEGWWEEDTTVGREQGSGIGESVSSSFVWGLFVLREGYVRLKSHPDFLKNNTRSNGKISPKLKFSY